MLTKRRIYFVGIGGIGVSALARWYLSEGWEVSGSDAERSVVTDDLKRRGAKISVGRESSAEIPAGTSLVVYSAAIGRNHPLRRQVRMRKFQQRSYASALGELTQRYKTIAVSGAHGKSTTTAMTALMLTRAGFDPTVVIGTRVREFENSNFRKGNSEWLVIEADEYHRSFLEHHPFAAVVTNVDREHLEYYGTFARIKQAFAVFFSHVSPDGFLVLNRENAPLMSITRPARRIYTFGTRGSRAGKIRKLLKVPGRHNLANAMACDTLGAALGIPRRVRDTALAAFRGTWRRFEYKGKFKGAPVYDDYAHHPTEIRATLQAVREVYPRRRVWCVFQPHHTERLARLFPDFVKALDDADRILVLETYRVRGRDAKKAPTGRDAKALVGALVKRQPAAYAAAHREILQVLRDSVKPGDVIVIMGAGDVTKISAALLN